MEKKAPSSLQRCFAFLLKTHYPKPTVKGTIWLFVIIGLLFIILGMVFTLVNSRIDQYEKRYDNQCKKNEQACKMPFTLPTSIQGPVYVFYGLTNFYQNHRRYIKSKSNQQLAGQNIPVSTAEQFCSPLITNAQMGKTKSVDNTDLDPNAIAWPCGLIAKSLFTDSFQLLNNLGQEITLKKDKITWPSDKGYKFKNGPGEWQKTQWTSVEDEAFISWMRTAGLPSFKKLYARIEQDLPAGDYTLVINNNYDSASFDGTKSVFISNTGTFGGRNIFLEVGYYLFGGVCFCISLVFYLKQRMSKGAFGGRKEQ